MFRRPLPAGAHAFTAWALLGGLVVYGFEAVMASALIVYAGALFVLWGLIRDTTEWRDTLGFGSGAGVFLVVVGALTIGYEPCALPGAQCAGTPTLPHIVTGAALLIGCGAVWSVLRRAVRKPA